MKIPALLLLRCFIYLAVCCAPALCNNLSNGELSKNEFSPLDSIGIRNPRDTDSILVLQDKQWVLQIQQIIARAPHSFSRNQWVALPLFDAELVLFVGKRKWIALVYPKSLCFSELIRPDGNGQGTRQDMNPGYCIEMDDENESELARLLKQQDVGISKTSSRYRMDPKTYQMLDSLRQREKSHGNVVQP